MHMPFWTSRGQQGAAFSIRVRRRVVLTFMVRAGHRVGRRARDPYFDGRVQSDPVKIRDDSKTMTSTFHESGAYIIGCFSWYVLVLKYHGLKRKDFAG